MRGLFISGDLCKFYLLVIIRRCESRNTEVKSIQNQEQSLNYNDTCGVSVMYSCNGILRYGFMSNHLFVDSSFDILSGTRRVRLAVNLSVVSDSAVINSLTILQYATKSKSVLNKEQI